VEGRKACLGRVGSRASIYRDYDERSSTYSNILDLLAVRFDFSYKVAGGTARAKGHDRD
jgi:hypothetical protein